MEVRDANGYGLVPAEAHALAAMSEGQRTVRCNLYAWDPEARAMKLVDSKMVTLHADKPTEYR